MRRFLISKWIGRAMTGQAEQTLKLECLVVWTVSIRGKKVSLVLRRPKLLVAELPVAHACCS